MAIVNRFEASKLGGRVQRSFNFRPVDLPFGMRIPDDGKETDDGYDCDSFSDESSTRLPIIEYLVLKPTGTRCHRQTAGETHGQRPAAHRFHGKTAA